ncbi:ATP-binding cassette domain-containing protein, partial [Dokdonia donghaensis]
MINELQLISAQKSFGSKEVLKDVSFTLQTGDILGLFGANGSGKSTLLKILFGTLKATKATLTINGS